MDEHIQPSVFTKIIRGELPSFMVFQDEQTVAFLPLHMSGKGHVLVVPKLQIDHFQDLDDNTYHAVMSTVKKVAQRMKEVLQTQRIGVKIVGLDVPHVHVHIIALDTLDDYNNSPDESGEPDHTALAAMADRLKFS